MTVIALYVFSTDYNLYLPIRDCRSLASSSQTFFTSSNSLFSWCLSNRSHSSKMEMEGKKQDFIWYAHCFEIDQIWISSCELFEKSCFIHSLVREKDVFWKLYRKVFKVKREKNHLCRIPPIDFYIIRSCHDYMCIVESARGLKSNLTALFPAIL